ncbi:MAG TPA: hypoxanthine phosphoribosyltransferase [Pirellulales bacterium]|jgi:hypoxanthine phosphoribosyltransferase
MPLTAHNLQPAGDTLRPILDEEQLREGVSRLADEINAHYEGRPLTIVGVLTGSVVLLADLIRLLDMPLKIGFVQATSYRGGTKPGELKLDLALLPEIAEREVLIVDDIFDSGHTLTALVEQFTALGPAQLRSAVLLRKAGRIEVPMQPDHVAFEIPNEFVVGYGLDYADLYRNLPHVAALDPADMTPDDAAAQAEQVIQGLGS